MKNAFPCSGTAAADRAADGYETPDTIIHPWSNIAELTESKQEALSKILLDSYGVIIVGSQMQAYSLQHLDGTVKAFDPSDTTVRAVTEMAKQMDCFLASPSVATVANVIRDTLAPSPSPLKDGNKVAKFIGIQPSGLPNYPDIALFNLTEQVGEKPIHDTVGIETLAKIGYSCPSMDVVYRATEDRLGNIVYIPIADLYAARTHDDAGEPLCNE